MLGLLPFLFSLSIYHSLVGEEVVVVTLLLVETKHSQVSELVSYSDSFHHCQRIVGGTAASQAINKRKCRGRLSIFMKIGCSSYLYTNPSRNDIYIWYSTERNQSMTSTKRKRKRFLDQLQLHVGKVRNIYYTPSI